MTLLCPWCDGEADDTPEGLPFFDGTFEGNCCACGEPITVRRVKTITYECDKRSTGAEEEDDRDGAAGSYQERQAAAQRLK